MLFTLFIGFLLGALAILALEGFGILLVLNKLNQKNKKLEKKLSNNKSNSQVPRDLHQSLDLLNSKQGAVWVLEPEKVTKPLPADKLLKEQKKKKDIIEVFPVRKYAKIKGQVLNIFDSDASHVEVPLRSCTVEAVSATSLSSRKWAKRYPIKLESKTAAIYKGNKTFYIYLDTSWEKESWCKALRIASCEDKKTIKWFGKLNTEFQNYLTTLNAGYPSFMKPSVSFYSEPTERENKLDDSSSKVRHFLKKLTRKASKTGDLKVNPTSSSAREERRASWRSHSFQDSVSGLSKVTQTVQTSNNPVTENHAGLLSSRSGSLGHVSDLSDVDTEERFGTDEGTLCWNLLITRLFFDAKNNADMRSSLRARIQRTLSNMRTPSYIGEVICTDINPGSLPPYIDAMRVLPTDMSEICVLEIDIKYSGGVVLDIETRLEVRELEQQKGLVDASSESSAGDVSPVLLEGFELLGEQLKLSEGGPVDAPEQEKGDSKLDRLKGSKSSISPLTNVSRWKSILNSVAKQVSQVPLSLVIRVASLRGTLRLHIKPPPSDQLWFGFTSMPDIEFNLESSVGEHKITNGHIALFLINRFKAAIRETLVIPNRESVCIPWMLAEKDDWVPRNIAPFMWLNQEGNNDSITRHEVPRPHSGEAKTKIEGKENLSNHSEDKPDVSKNARCVLPPTIKSSDSPVLPSDKPRSSVEVSKSEKEQKTSLLKNDNESPESSQHIIEENLENQSPSRPIFSAEDRSLTLEDDEGRPKRMGRRAKMFDLGKKVSEKLEEKRRNLEEKSRQIVEKMLEERKAAK